MFFRNPKAAPHVRRWPKRLVALCLLGGLTAAADAATQPAPKPFAQLNLRELGFPGYQVSLLHQGASMASVHLLDATHALFTYSLRSLVPRLPDDDANDSDREVGAVLVDLSSARVLARTKWHLHDHGRYLWSVGGGVFVVRVGADLSVMAPMRGLNNGEEPFRRYALPHRPGLPIAINGSPDGKVITVELEQKGAPILGDTEDGERRRRQYVLEFYRLHLDEKPGTAPVRLEGAGVVGSPVALRLALDGDGYLWAEDGQRGRWMVSFNEFRGHEEKLAPVLSSCHPRLNLLSRSQFLVETCRGSDLQPVLSAYGFDGHENWEEPFGGEALQPPTLALAPVAGRFALSRLYASANGEADRLLDTGPLAQEIRVYQTESGDVLLRLQCAPAVRSAENFDLSPDGKVLAVLAAQSLDLYRLPELTAKDRKDLAEVQTMTPEAGSGPVSLASVTRPVAAPEPVSGGAAVRATDDPTPQPGPAADAPRTAAAVAAAPARPVKDKEARAAIRDASGDPVTDTRRTPPTLLNPGEKAEFKGRPTQPQ